jgi:hypothetical protein
MKIKISSNEANNIIDSAIQPVLNKIKKKHISQWKLKQAHKTFSPKTVTKKSVLFYY